MTSNVFNKKLLATLICTAGLAGCLDDPYDYPDNGGTTPPEETSKLQIYGPGSDGSFGLKLINSDDLEADVPENGTITHGNTSTLARSLDPQGRLRVEISNNLDGAILASSSTPIDIEVEPEKAMLAFDLAVNDKPLSNQSVKLATQMVYDKDAASIDISSVVKAYTGSVSQNVQVPLTCFTDSGMDYTQTLTPFMLQSNNNLDVELSNIRISTFDTPVTELDQTHILECNNTSDAVTDNVKNVYVLAADTNNGNSIWATNLGFWATDGTLLQPDWPRGGEGFITFEFKDKGPNPEQLANGVNGGFVFEVPGNTQDLSEYIERGVLSFKINVENYGNHPTKRLQVQIESTKGNSNPHMLPSGFALNKLEQVTIPLKELFADEKGQIAVSKLTNVNKPVSILPEWVDENNTIEGIKVHIGKIQLIMNP